MGSFSLAHWIIVLIIIIIIFGAKRLPAIGSGLGQGIKNFKKSIKGDEELEAKKDENGSKET